MLDATMWVQTTFLLIKEKKSMTRTFDLTPFTRATVGFERLFNQLDHQAARQTGYPPYDIVKHSDDHYTITLAVAGFDMDRLEITQNQRLLSVEGKRPDLDADVEYLYKGIANREFRRDFTLAEHVEVIDANLKNGILHIQLQRQVPDELQPKRIAIA